VVREGRLRYREDIVDGIENCPGAIAELYRGENLGKRLVHLRKGRSLQHELADQQPKQCKGAEQHHHRQDEHHSDDQPSN
jgi:hypothetical protein